MNEKKEQFEEVQIEIIRFEDQGICTGGIELSEDTWG